MTVYGMLLIYRLKYKYQTINERFHHFTQDYIVISHDKPIFDCRNGINNGDIIQNDGECSFIV